MRRRPATTAIAKMANMAPREWVRKAPNSNAHTGNRTHRKFLAACFGVQKMNTSGIVHTMSWAKSLGSLISPKPLSRYKTDSPPPIAKT